MYRFMKSMGYDLSKDIHLQFCERYNLKPKKRRYNAKNTYCFDELEERFNPEYPSSNQ